MITDAELLERVCEQGEPRAWGPQWAVAAFDHAHATMHYLTVVAATERQARHRAEEYLRRIKSLTAFDLMDEVEPV